MPYKTSDPPKFKPGDILTPSILNRLSKAVLHQLSGGRGVTISHHSGRSVVGLSKHPIISPPKGGGGGGGGLSEIVIKKVLADALDVDPADMQESADFDAFGPHIRAHPIRACIDGDPEPCNGVVNTAAVLIVQPGRNQSIGDFIKSSGVGEPNIQIFNVADPDNPTWFATNTARGLVMTIGQGEDWVDEPDPMEICGVGFIEGP